MSEISENGEAGALPKDQLTDARAEAFAHRFDTAWCDAVVLMDGIYQGVKSIKSTTRNRLRLAERLIDLTDASFVSVDELAKVSCELLRTDEEYQESSVRVDMTSPDESEELRGVLTETALSVQRILPSETDKYHALMSGAGDLITIRADLDSILEELISSSEELRGVTISKQIWEELRKAVESYVKKENDDPGTGDLSQARLLNLVSLQAHYIVMKSNKAKPIIKYMEREVTRTRDDVTTLTVRVQASAQTLRSN